MNSANNKKFSHSQFETYFSHSDFFTKTLTKYLKLHLLCLDGNNFKNGIKRALGPSGLV